MQTKKNLVPGETFGGVDRMMLLEVKFEGLAVPTLICVRVSPCSLFRIRFSQRPRISIMDAKSQRPKGRRGALSTLSVAVDALNVAKDISCIAPAQAAFSAVSVLLTMIRVSSLLFCRGGFPIHFYPGLHGQRTGLRRTRTELRGYL